jgi:pimeloyl-ACP methyl ester carboxylesterase
VETESIRANGIEIHYHAAGDGPLVVCLHGFPDTASTFASQLSLFAGAGFRAVAPYLRGYAPTTVAEDGYQAAVLAQDALAFIDALGYESAMLVGHDWGSGIAMGAARWSASIRPGSRQRSRRPQRAGRRESRR